MQDPREALIVSLKREVGILYQENNHLRKLVELSDGSDSNGSGQARALLGSSHSNMPLDGRGAHFKFKLSLKKIIPWCSFDKNDFLYVNFLIYFIECGIGYGYYH